MTTTRSRRGETGGEAEHAADATFQVLSCVADRSGCIALLLAAPADAAPAYSLVDPRGTIYRIAPSAVRVSTLSDVNLVAASDAPTEWAISSAAGKADVGRNLADWILEGEDTCYLRTGEAVEGEDVAAAATLVDPVTGGTTPVRPGARYRFSMLMATHRCGGALKVELLSEAGEVLYGESLDAGRRHKGGGDAARYDHAAIEFTAPAGAAKLRVSVEKGPTEQKTNSYVFYARPELRDLSQSRGGPAVVLSAALLGVVRSNVGGTVNEVVLAVPDEVFAGRNVHCELVVSCGERIERTQPLTLQKSPTLEITTLKAENGLVLVHGRTWAPITAPLNIGVFVDGELNTQFEPQFEDRLFKAQILLAPEHLDGRPHVVELRALPSQAPLAHTYEILPAHITAWHALQTYATAPLNITASPAAPHHFRAYKAWAEHAAEHGGTIPANLSALHDELLQGFRKRAHYPPIAFPQVADPDVSIIVPVHNKFEMTYSCLCALLFAFNRTRFEVIVVDDGSSDQTMEINDVVSGISVVSHNAALGFVHSCNDGARIARGRYIAFLNNDTEVTAGWLDELVEVFGDFDNVGLVGPKLLYPSGKLQEAGGVVWRNGNPGNVGRSGNPHDPKYNYLRQADYLPGAAILLPRDLWEQLGGFSKEMAPAYFEDTDLAMKVQDAGKLVAYVPSANVFHYEGQTAGGDVTAGMKRYQEINRPKFKRKWAHLFASHGVQGVAIEREKDRAAAFRVLYVDERFPMVDADAGGYSAFQEVRLLQAMGAKVSFLPKNLAWMDRHTLALQKIGVECLYQPFVSGFESYVREHAAEYDVVYICRYKLAERLIETIREVAPAAKVVLNLADLHFLREMREAGAGSPGYTYEQARETRDAELAVVASADLTLSYSDVEIAVIGSNLGTTAKVARLPWVVDLPETQRAAFAETRNLLFLGGFGHPPNIEAVKFFIRDVMPLLADRMPGVNLTVVGSKAPPDVLELASATVDIQGYLANLDAVFDRSRVFVAPLLAGAGIKGKVLEAMARGIPCVLSPIAAEGTGLVDGVDCLIARTSQEWVEAIARLYTDEALNTAIGAAARRAAATRFSFARGSELMQDSLAQIDLFASGRPTLVYKHARPRTYG